MKAKREIKPRDSVRPSCVNSSIRVSQLSTEYCAQSETNIEQKRKMAAMLSVVLERNYRQT